MILSAPAATDQCGRDLCGPRDLRALPVRGASRAPHVLRDHRSLSTLATRLHGGRSGGFSRHRCWNDEAPPRRIASQRSRRLITVLCARPIKWPMAPVFHGWHWFGMIILGHNQLLYYYSTPRSKPQRQRWIGGERACGEVAGLVAGPCGGGDHRGVVR